MLYVKTQPCGRSVSMDMNSLLYGFSATFRAAIKDIENISASSVGFFLQLKWLDKGIQHTVVTPISLLIIALPSPRCPF